MAEFSDYLEDKIISHFLVNAPSTAATAYVGLYTADPLDDNSGAEVGITGYSRKYGWFGPASGGAVSNTAEVNFGAATAAWSTVTHVGILDAETSGNLLMHSALDVEKIIAEGDTFKFNENDLDVTVA